MTCKTIDGVFMPACEAGARHGPWCCTCARDAAMPGDLATLRAKLARLARASPPPTREVVVRVVVERSA